MASFISRLMFLLNTIAIIFLLLSYTASYISPDGNFWWLQIIGLAYGSLLITNFCFIIFWLLMRKKKFLFSLFAILVGFSKIFGIVELRLSGSESGVNDTTNSKLQTPNIKVMSFNVRLFDLYNWFHNTETRKKIFEFLKQESPDVICFQEYYHTDPTRHGDFYANNDTLRSIIPAAYSHIEYNLTLREHEHFGIATFSKYPIINKQALHFKKRGGNIFIYSDVVVAEDTLRIVNAHLESIRFKEEDYRYIENISNDVEQEDVTGGIRILKRMRRAYGVRARQVDVLKDSINKSPYPVIVCGDFNDTPSSYTYHKIADGLVDSFRESGSGFGKTYAGLFPSFRIDYIFHDPRLKSFNYTTHNQKLSDHYAISCRMAR